MASAWWYKRKLASGNVSYRVIYRLGGRESKMMYAGAFDNEHEAKIRRDWVACELAAMRVPNIRNHMTPGPEFVMCPACENVRLVSYGRYWWCVDCGYEEERGE